MIFYMVHTICVHVYISVSYVWTPHQPHTGTFFSNHIGTCFTLPPCHTGYLVFYHWFSNPRTIIGTLWTLRLSLWGRCALVFIVRKGSRTKVRLVVFGSFWVLGTVVLWREHGIRTPEFWNEHQVVTCFLLWLHCHLLIGINTGFLVTVL